MLDRPLGERYRSCHDFSPEGASDLAFWPWSASLASEIVGAQRGNRTLDLFITSEMLYRLSYLGDGEMLAAPLHDHPPDCRLR